jgi:hypothetical protein
MLTQKTIDRFESLVDKESLHNGCWLWNGQINPSGYGYFYIEPALRPIFGLGPKTSSVRAHKFAYYLQHGHVPDRTKCVCHTCDIKPCVNPDHLFSGTNKDNTQDMLRKNRQPKGGPHKLTDSMVYAILDLLYLGVSGQKVARIFEVDPRLIRFIKKRKIWKHIEHPYFDK